MLDHGLLNLPLNKRGGKSIDRELDEYKAHQAQEAQDWHFLNRENYKELKKEALEMFGRIDMHLLKACAEKQNMKPRELLKIIKETCSDNPRRAIKLIRGFIVE